jgi:hypothetical protein
MSVSVLQITGEKEYPFLTAEFIDDSVIFPFQNQSIFICFSFTLIHLTALAGDVCQCLNPIFAYYYSLLRFF